MAVENYITKGQIETLLRNLKDELDTKENIIESISLNGTPITPINKNVALTVITNAVNNLINYYTKSETYTKNEIDGFISAITTLNIRVVETLPTENISTTTIYLVPAEDPGTQNIKDEYINLTGTSEGWEKIGSTEIDLSDYVTDEELETSLATFRRSIRDRVLNTSIATVETNLTNSSKFYNPGDIFMYMMQLYKVTDYINQDGEIRIIGENPNAVAVNLDDILAERFLQFMKKGKDYVTAGQKAETTLGEHATAEGTNTTASGGSSHAEGGMTIAEGSASHAEGAKTTASGTGSHAEGTQTLASGYYSHAGGRGTIAQRMSQVAIGQYNIADTQGANEEAKGEYAFIIGNGSSSSRRSNAFTVDWSGNVRVGSQSELLATQNYVNSGSNVAHTNAEETITREWTFEDNIYANGLLGIVGTSASFQNLNDVYHIVPLEDTINIDSYYTYFNDTILVNTIRTNNNGAGVVVFGDDLDMNSNNIENVDSITAITYNTPNSDYSEKFEELEPCPKCRFVTLEGDKIKLAQSSDDYILGITSEKPSIIGDKDIDGIPVGLLGKLWVDQDGTAEVNGYVITKENGIATKAEVGYRVIEVKDNKARIIFR